VGVAVSLPFSCFLTRILLNFCASLPTIGSRRRRPLQLTPAGE
jgi:hypothetical protein